MNEFLKIIILPIAIFVAGLVFIDGPEPSGSKDDMYHDQEVQEALDEKDDDKAATKKTSISDTLRVHPKLQHDFIEFEVESLDLASSSENESLNQGEISLENALEELSYTEKAIEAPKDQAFPEEQKELIAELEAEMAFEDQRQVDDLNFELNGGRHIEWTEEDINIVGSLHD